MDIVTPGKAIHPGNLESIAKERGQVQSKGASVARFGAIEAGFLAIFAAIVAIAIAHHEPWSDEAQAWQLARNLSLHDLFVTGLHYECHPGLWYVYLRALILTGISFSGMHWICGGIGVASTWFLLRYSPFPRYLKILFPFTFFLLFQYVVVARSYVFAPILFYLVAWRWRKSPIVIALLLGLMTNLELHLTAIAVGLAIVYCIEKFSNRANVEFAHHQGLLFAGFLFAGLTCFALWTAWPARDFTQFPLRGESPGFVAKAVWSLVFGTCDPIYVAPFLWIAICLWLHEKGRLIYILPVFLFACFSGVSVCNLWHAGLVNPLLISILWVNWPNTPKRASRFEYFCLPLLVVVFGTQVLWTSHALTYDYRYSYSGDAAAANFLKPYVRQRKTIAVTSLDQIKDQSFFAVGILPYFQNPIFSNWKEPFWRSSSRNTNDEQLDSLIRSRPAIIILEATLSSPNEHIESSNERIKFLVASGYQVTERFCGNSAARFVTTVTACHIILQDSQKPTGPHV